MSKKFLIPIDMTGLEIQNFLAHNLAAAPTAAEGKIYFNTADKKLYYYNGTAWVAVTEGAIYTGTSPISVSGTAISHANSGVTAASKGDTANQTPTWGGTFKVPSGTVNATGHLTAFADHTVTIPGSEASTSAKGLMSSTDKTKLNGIASGAEVNPEPVTDAELTAGTSTAERVITPKVIHDYVATVAASVDAMRFKGTIGTGGTVTTLPTSGVKVGDTYRVITAGTYASQVCEVGDLIIATATTPTWTVAQTNIDGAITSITGTSPISVTGSGASRTVSIGAASGSAAGSMSAAHYTKLNGLTATKTGTVTLASGSTSVDASVSDIISYTAKDATTGEEVVLDVTKASSKVTFSIAAAYTNAITITYLTAA